MARLAARSIGLSLLLIAGCGPGAMAPDATSRTARRPIPTTSEEAGARPLPEPTPSVVESTDANASADTDKDRRFAEFVKDHARGMVKDVAVAIDRKGTMQVVLGEATGPEDTLPLTQSLMSGARKEFRDRPILLTVFDPSREPILKASYRPGHGVDYQVVRGDGRAAEASPAEAAPDPRRYATDKDRTFADWAMEKGHDFLRYVEADLDRHGRLWFGVTRDVAPEDVRALTRSLLEGARTEFPGGELTATVFDPEGEKIGRATLDKDGQVRWSR
jgi:hypothetical protein